MNSKKIGNCHGLYIIHFNIRSRYFKQYGILFIRKFCHRSHFITTVGHIFIRTKHNVFKFNEVTEIEYSTIETVINSQKRKNLQPTIITDLIIISLYQERNDNQVITSSINHTDLHVLSKTYPYLQNGYTISKKKHTTTLQVEPLFRIN